MGRRKTFLNSRKNPQIVSVRLIHLKKKTKKIDSFIWGRVLNTMVSWGKHYVFQVQSKTKTSDKAGESLVGTSFGGCSSWCIHWKGPQRVPHRVLCGSLQDTFESGQARCVNIAKGAKRPNCDDTIIWGIFPHITQAFHLASFNVYHLSAFKKCGLYIEIFPLETKCSWEFPGGSVVRIQCFHCCGPRFDSWSGN